MLEVFIGSCLITIGVWMWIDLLIEDAVCKENGQP
jgi:hypothetical protein